MISNNIEISRLLVTGLRIEHVSDTDMKSFTNAQPLAGGYEVESKTLVVEETNMNLLKDDDVCPSSSFTVNAVNEAVWADGG